MSGLVIYVGAAESELAAGPHVCILSGPGCSITLSISSLPPEASRCIFIGRCFYYFVQP